MAMPLRNDDDGLAEVVNIFRNVSAAQLDDPAVSDVVARAEEIIEAIEYQEDLKGLTSVTSVRDAAQVRIDRQREELEAHRAELDRELRRVHGALQGKVDKSAFAAWTTTQHRNVTVLAAVVVVTLFVTAISAILISRLNSGLEANQALDVQQDVAIAAQSVAIEDLESVNDSQDIVIEETSELAQANAEEIDKVWDAVGDLEEGLSSLSDEVSDIKDDVGAIDNKIAVLPRLEEDLGATRDAVVEIQTTASILSDEIGETADKLNEFKTETGIELDNLSDDLAAEVTARETAMEAQRLADARAAARLQAQLDTVGETAGQALEAIDLMAAYPPLSEGDVREILNDLINRPGSTIWTTPMVGFDNVNEPDTGWIGGIGNFLEDHLTPGIDGGSTTSAAGSVRFESTILGTEHIEADNSNFVLLSVPRVVDVEGLKLDENLTPDSLTRRSFAQAACQSVAVMNSVVDDIRNSMPAGYEIRWFGNYDVETAVSEGLGTQDVYSCIGL